MTIEQRSATRYEIIKGGFVVFNAGSTTLPCIVRELSATGVRISMASTTGVPALFTLAVPGSSSVMCRLIWHSDTELGGAFVGSAIEVSFADEEIA